MKIRLGVLAILLVLWPRRVMAQQAQFSFSKIDQAGRRRFSRRGKPRSIGRYRCPCAQHGDDWQSQGHQGASGGDYGTGQPLCSPQISLSPKSNCTKGQHWWCDPCGFGGWGCGTPVRTFAKNSKTTSLFANSLRTMVSERGGCNCSGQGPYAMDWSQPDRRSCRLRLQGFALLISLDLELQRHPERVAASIAGHNAAMAIVRAFSSIRRIKVRRCPMTDRSKRLRHRQGIAKIRASGATKGNGAKIRNVAGKGEEETRHRRCAGSIADEEDRFTAEDLRQRSQNRPGQYRRTISLALLPKVARRRSLSRGHAVQAGQFSPAVIEVLRATSGGSRFQDRGYPSLSSRGDSYWTP